MPRQIRSWIGFGLALVAAVVLANRMPNAPSAPETGESVARGSIGSSLAPAPGAPEASRSGPVGETMGGAGAQAKRPGYGADVGFRTRRLLVEHYEKHGREFEGATRDDYLRMAQSLRDVVPAGGGIVEVVRSDGVVTRFDRATGAFLAFDPDGTIRTFFRPRDGERYFRRQALRGER